MAQAVVLVGFASWAFGGRVSWAPDWIVVLAAAGAVPLLLSFWEARRAQGQSPTPGGGCERKCRGWILLPWVILAILLAISLFNPSYRAMAPDSGGGLALREHIQWLPSTVSTGRTAGSFRLLGAILFQAVVVSCVAQRRRALRLLLVLLCANALLLAVAGTAFHLLGEGKIAGLYASPNPFFFATFVYKNHWAAFSLLAVSASLALLFKGLDERQQAARRTRHTPLPFFVAVPILLAPTIPLAGSRSGTALLLVLFAGAVARGVSRMMRRPEMPVWQKRLAAVGCMAAVSVLVAVYYDLAGPSIARDIRKTEEQFQGYRESDRLEDRFYIFRDTWGMAAAKPVYGWGLGSFPLVIPAFQGKEFRDGNTGEINRHFVDAHNDWLQFLAEIGWVGVILLLATPLLAFYLYLVHGAANAFSRWAFFGCSLVLVYAIIDFPFQNPAVFLLFSILFASAARYGLLEQRLRAGREAPPLAKASGAGSPRPFLRFFRLAGSCFPAAAGYPQ